MSLAARSPGDTESIIDGLSHLFAAWSLNVHNKTTCNQGVISTHAAPRRRSYKVTQLGFVPLGTGLKKTK